MLNNMIPLNESGSNDEQGAGRPFQESSHTAAKEQALAVVRAGLDAYDNQVVFAFLDLAKDGGILVSAAHGERLDRDTFPIAQLLDVPDCSFCGFEIVI